MWKLIFQRAVKKSWCRAAAWFRSQQPRRARRFAIAEALESRALLSATGADSSPIFSQDDGPTIPGLIVSEGVTNGDKDVNSKGDFGSEQAWLNRGLAGVLDTHGQSSAPEFLFGLSDAAFAVIAQGRSNQRGPDIDRLEAIHGQQHPGPFSGMFASISERSVEIRFAESGQIVPVGSSSTVQDSNGLTVSDESGPATYLHATDSDGRVYSRLVFVTRTSRSAPNSDPATTDDASGIVIVDAELPSEPVDEELVARSDLHDLETALDAVNSDSFERQTAPSEGNRPLLAATTRTLRTSSSRTATERATANEIAATRKRSSDETSDDANPSSDELSVAPVFDPTTRNVVLSVCVLGALARANARRRRRQKVALAQ